ncbi:MAG: inositol monophosphatase family protein [bacterium]
MAQSFTGKIIKGEGIARHTGYPTLNLARTSIKGKLPKNGVWAVWAWLDSAQIPAILVLGVPYRNKSVKRNKIEIHLLNSEKITQGFIKVELLQYLRPIKKYHNPVKLKADIKNDIAKTKLILNKYTGADLPKNTEQFVVHLVKKVGRTLAQEFYKQQRVLWRDKYKTQIVTKFDLLADKIILEAIKNKFPDHSILSEESGSYGQRSDYVWVVDPLDGTTNFAMKNPFFCISIALTYKSRPILGVVYNPLIDELFTARTTKGAKLNNKNIKVSKTYQLNHSFLSFCYGNRILDIKRAIKLFNKLKLTGKDMRQLGSAALEGCYVASGRTDALIVPGAHPWDVAAGALIAQEAGAMVTDFQGNDWTMQSKDILIASPQIHSLLIKRL